MQYVLVNNEIQKKSETNLSNFLWKNPFLLQQKIWFGYGGIPLLNENLHSLKKQLNLLGFALPPLFNQPRELFRLCKRMLNKNKFFRSGVLNVQLFAKTTNTNLLITPQPRNIFDFPLSAEGLIVNISDLRKNSHSPLQEMASHGIWQAARRQLKNTPCHNSLLLNDKNFVCEGLNANVFLLKNNLLITPSPESGCYTNILRSLIISLSNQMHIKVMESDEIPREMLFAADEIFLASEANGIEWILGIDSKRFIRSFSLELHEKLNTILEQKAALR